MLLLTQNRHMQDLIPVPEDTIRVGCRLLTNSISCVQAQIPLFQEKCNEGELKSKSEQVLYH